MKPIQELSGREPAGTARIKSPSREIKLIDSYGRRIDYMRISITDHCNLNCCYCMPVSTERCQQKRSDILTYEETLQVAEAAVSAGITKIRITGGEPLVRNDVVELCRMLSRIGLKSLSITTNGVRLNELARPLYAAGVHRINISLDTLKRSRFEMITGHDRFDDVWAGIAMAESVGFKPLKINMVVMRGVNDDEIASLAALTHTKPYHVRFIELMPFQNTAFGDYQDLYVPIAEIIKKIPGINNARISPSIETGGPARLCSLPGAIGKIGFIAPRSWHFCGGCNRLRLTADGKIRTCLFSDEEIDIKTTLRNGAYQRDLIQVIRDAVARKPRRRNQDNTVRFGPRKRSMNTIGG